MRVCIIGGGIIGLSIAFELALRKINVSVVDPQFQAGRASRVAGGMLEPLGDLNVLEMGLQSLALYPDFLARLKSVSFLETGYAHGGALYINQTLADYQNSLPLLHSYSFDLTGLDTTGSKKLEPLLHDSIVSSVYAPATSQIEPGKTFYALYDACGKLDVEFIPHSAHRLIEHQNRIVAAETAQGKIEADYFVIASGAWSSLLLRNLKTDQHVSPVKGQIITMRTNSKPQHIIHDKRSVYIIPRADDRVTIGATVVADAGFDLSLQSKATDYLKAEAVRLLPALDGADIINAAVGFRPHPGSSRPVMGMIDGYENLSGAFGHYRSGILLAPLTAQKIVQTILDR